VRLDTDGYSEDLSWDLRDVDGNLVMSGGDTDIVGALAQAGSVDFDNFESFSSTACLPPDTCYDFRAYDVYGDGISCGVDGSISLSFPGGTTLLQQDENVASLQRLDDGTKTMACMDKKDNRGLQTWSFCHLRVCQDGSVTGLEGNQCSFGDDKLIDPNATGNIVGVGMQMNSQAAGSQVANDKPCAAGEDCTMAEEFSFTEPELMTASIDDKEEDLSWAEYYHQLINLDDSKGKGKPIEGISPNSQAVSSQHEEYKLSLEPFYINLLSPDSPYKLKYYRPHQISNAISIYLLKYLHDNTEGCENDNAPLHFELDCNKSSRQFDSDSVRVIECNGDAVFPKSLLPQNNVMNDMIHQAFAGENHVEFLKFMYVDYYPEAFSSAVEESTELSKKEKKEQKLQDQLQQNSEKSNDKKDEKNDQREQFKNDGFSKREWKKELRNQADGRHLRSGFIS
jgi:hypothetical protein